MRLMRDAGRNVVVFISAIILTIIVGPSEAFSQPPQPPSSTNIQSIIDRAEESYRKGVEEQKRGNLTEARKMFDQSVDIIMLSGISLSENVKLDAYYRELLDRIHKHEALPEDNHQPVQQPAAVVEVVEPSVLDELSEIKEDELATVTPSGIKIYGSYDFDFSVAPPVFQFINFFVSGRGRSTMETGLKRSGRYRQMAEKIFKEERVPLDLIWLAQAESVWKPNALSHAAAKGIWQFIPATGSQYGLGQTQWVDDRSHPEKSTRAAARYLRFLHDHFAGDWLLAMAAYNSGENRVDRIISKLGYADFWEIHKRGLLPQETRNYVPIILAIMIISKNQQRYGFNVQPDPAMKYDTFELAAQTDLKVAAELIGVPYESLQDLNPELRRGTTPPGRSYTLKLPKGTRDQFALAYAKLPEEERVRKVVIPASIVAVSTRPRQAYRAQAASYQVRGGDTLAALAKRHGISVRELARANGISARGKLRKGQSVLVPASASTRASKSERRKADGRNNTRDRHASASRLKGRANRYVEKKAASSRLNSRSAARGKKRNAAPERRSSRRRR